MRLDKYLKVSRLIKRRTVANEACSVGKVYINGKESKPAADVKEGDIIELTLGAHPVKVRVEKLLPAAGKDDAGSMYSVIENS